MQNAINVTSKIRATTVAAAAIVALLQSAGVTSGIKYLEESSSALDADADEAQSPNSSGAASAASSNSLRMSVATADLTKMRWERSFGGARTDLFHDVVVRRTDFAVISAGSSMSKSVGRKDAWVVATDSEGSLLWERSIGGALDEEAFAITDTSEGDIILGGADATSGTGGGAGFVYRLGAAGDDVWQYNFDSPQADSISALAVLDNGDIIAAGTSGAATTIAVRLTPDGSVVWENTYTSDTPQVVRTILQAKNGDVFLIGETTPLFDSDGAIARLSSSGKMLWGKNFGESFNETLADAVLLRSGDVLAVGRQERDSGDDAWLLRVSADGELTWSKNIGGPGEDSLEGIALRADQTVIAVGTQSANSLEQDNAWLLELADDGSVSRAQTYGGDHKESFSAVTSRSDGSVVTVGFKQAWHDEPINAYTAIIGAPIRQVAMRGASATLNPPVVFVPGEGKLLTDRSSVEVLGNVIHDKPIQQLFVDGRPTEVLQNGAFTARVSVPLGTTRVRVEAVDGDGGVGSSEITVTRVEQGSIGIANLASLKDKIQFGNYHALVIGNNKYAGDLPVLETAERDARAIADVLQSDYGFDVDLLVNAGHDEIVNALETKSSEMREDDNLLIYYAGHGFYDEDVDIGYWLPIDANLDTKGNWIRNSTITDSIKSMQAKHVMLVADSCFSGTLLRSVDVQRSGRFYEQMASRSARLVMTSGGVEPVMDGGGDGHSVFARSFLNKLESGEEIIDGTSLFQAIREPVILGSEQVPQYSNIRFVDSDGGDFLFVRKSD